MTGHIIIHPTNPDIVYIAAMGRLWGRNKDRGVFKTTDGGRTWKKILYIDDTIGVNDIQFPRPPTREKLGSRSPAISQSTARPGSSARTRLIHRCFTPVPNSVSS